MWTPCFLVYFERIWRNLKEQENIPLSLMNMYGLSFHSLILKDLNDTVSIKGRLDGQLLPPTFFVNRFSICNTELVCLSGLVWGNQSHSSSSSQMRDSPLKKRLHLHELFEFLLKKCHGLSNEFHDQ